LTRQLLPTYRDFATETTLSKHDNSFPSTGILPPRQLFHDTTTPARLPGLCHLSIFLYGRETACPFTGALQKPNQWQLMLPNTICFDPTGYFFADPYYHVTGIM